LTYIDHRHLHECALSDRGVDIPTVDTELSDFTWDDMCRTVEKICHGESFALGDMVIVANEGELEDSTKPAERTPELGEQQVGKKKSWLGRLLRKKALNAGRNPPPPCSACRKPHYPVTDFIPTSLVKGLPLANQATSAQDG